MKNFLYILYCFIAIDLSFAMESPTDAKNSAPENGKKKAVIVSTGALNPCHKNHIRAFARAKQELEKCGNEVVGAFMSPSHNNYVRGKMEKTYSSSMKEVFVDARHRSALCACVIRDAGLSDWLHVDMWEAEQGYFIDYYEVAAHIRGIVQPYDVEVWYLMGSDHANKFPCPQGLRNGIKVIIDPRAGNEPNFTCANSEKCIILPIDHHNTLSSTEVRKHFDALRLGIDLKQNVDILETYLGRTSLVAIVKNNLFDLGKRHDDIRALYPDWEEWQANLTPDSLLPNDDKIDILFPPKVELSTKINSCNCT